MSAPLVSLTRWDRLTRGPTIFNPDTGRTIMLEDYPNYSVVIPLAPDSPSATSNQVFISRRVSGPGEFTVEAPTGYGVMAIIQSLDLRVAEDACNDFILVSVLAICHSLTDYSGMSFIPGTILNIMNIYV